MKRTLLMIAAVVLSAACISPASAQSYTITQLGTLRTDGEGSSLALGINNLGQVVGAADTDQGTRRAFVWRPGVGIVDLQNEGVTLGGSYSSAWGINDQGHTVGEANIPGSLQNPFQFSHAFLHMGSMFDLNGAGAFLGGQNSRTTAINAGGQTCGLAQDQQGRWRAFRYAQSSGITDLGTLGGLSSRANGLNDLGEVAGTADMPDGSMRGTLWSPSRGTFTFFFNRSRVCEAYDVNNAGIVIGSGLVGRQTRAFAGDTVTRIFRTLPGRGGAVVTVAKDVNNSGRIVGWSGGNVAPLQKAVMWVGRRMVDLNTRIPRRSGWVLWRANAINEEGQIVGEGRFNGRNRAFLLTPQ